MRFGWRGEVDYWIAHRLPVPGPIRRRVCDWYDNWLSEGEESWPITPSGEPPSTPESFAG